MAYKITISRKAEDSLDEIFEYLVENWSEKIKNNFKNKLNNEINYLRQNPYMYQASNERQDIRRCFITKHNALYYRILENEVEIITIHNTKSNPDSLIF